MAPYKTYSYDIFDTCLVRACGSCMAVYDLMAKSVLGAGKGDGSLCPDFVTERCAAELRARKKLIHGKKEEVTLEEIYEECDFSAFTSMPKRVIMQVELEIEKAVLMPVREIKKEIDGLHAQGQCILFVSDTYLPEGFLRDVLTMHGLFKDGDALFVSSSTFKTEALGSLFRLIRKQLHVDYKAWIHKGDNRYCDFYMPQELGIHAEHVVFR